MSYYIRNGNSFSQTDEKAMDIYDALPAGFYTIKVSEQIGYYFEQVDAFTLPAKLYGDLTKNADRIQSTFDDRTTSTGLLLSGEKGSGKTLLAKKMGIQAVERDMPCVIINQPHCGEAFNTFIQQMKQPAVILFDEFEKVYDAEQQEAVLTLLDGVYPTKKLFIITSNDRYRIDQHMRNRPGRIFYALDFEGLDAAFVKEYALDNLSDKEKAGSVVNVSAMFNKFNFDMLKALVEEMNRYGETAQEALKMLNAKPESNVYNEHEIALEINGVVVEPTRLEETTWTGNPLSGEVSIWLDCNIPEDNREEYISMRELAAKDNGYHKNVRAKAQKALDSMDVEEGAELIFENTDLHKVDGETGTFVYKTKDEELGELTLTLTRTKKEKFDAFRYVY